MGRILILGLVVALLSSGQSTVIGTGVSGIAKTKQDTAKPTHMLSFTLSARRLSPATVEVPEGQYRVRLRNGELIDDIAFLLEDAGNKSKAGRVEVRHGEPVKKVARQDGAYFDLAPGTYVLTVENHQEWKATIVVTAVTGGGK